MAEEHGGIGDTARLEGIPESCHFPGVNTVAVQAPSPQPGPEGEERFSGQAAPAGADTAGEHALSPAPPHGAPSLTEEPPPYSPPDPKMAYLAYPPPSPYYLGQQVITCQPGPNLPAFYQPQFMPSPSYPPYSIYMSGLEPSLEQTPLPKDYLVESLLVTVFCCLLSGLLAFSYSLKTRSALARGDLGAGERASHKARLLVLFSLLSGVCMCVGWIVYVVVALCA